MTNPPTPGLPAAPVSSGGAPAPVWPADAHPSPAAGGPSAPTSGVPFPPTSPAGGPYSPGSAGGGPFPPASAGGVPQGGYGVPAPGYPGGPVPATLSPGPMTPGGQPIATFGERLVAYLVDSMIQTGVVSIMAIPAYLIVVIGVLHSGNGGSTTVAEAALGLVLFEVVIYTLFSYLYHVEWILRSGSTVGKRLMKLRIVPLEGGPTPLARPALARRWVGQYVLGFIPFYSYVDGFWQLWDQPYKQCLHDKWPRTAVVKVVA